MLQLKTLYSFKIRCQPRRKQESWLGASAHFICCIVHPSTDIHADVFKDKMETMGWQEIQICPDSSVQTFNV